MTVEDEGGQGQTVPPLRKHKLDGALYVRPPDIERLLAGLIQLASAEALARAAIRRRSAAGWLPGECLVHMMRRAGRERDQRAYDRWCALVLERVAAAVPAVSARDASSTDALAISDYAIDRFVQMLGPDLAGYDERLDIWEARFDLALANLRRDALRRCLPAVNEENVAIDDDPALMAEIERAVGAFNPLDEAEDEDADFRSRVWAAIDALPTEQNRILTMMREGLPVGTGARGEKSISGILERTPRTILNHKVRAFEAVRRAVEGDGQ